MFYSLEISQKLHSRDGKTSFIVLTGGGSQWEAFVLEGKRNIMIILNATSKRATKEDLRPLLIYIFFLNWGGGGEKGEER